MGSTLYIVGTPIGNLEDITVRASRVLASVDRIVAEDTRRTRALLSHLSIESKAVASLDANAREREIERELAHLLAGESIALVTDAGMPTVSDPGSALVSAALAKGILVVPIPGPSAVTTAVAASGFVSGGFLFLGFLPRGGTSRSDLLARIASTPEPVLLFESKHRLPETLKDLSALMPDRPAVVAREMTKIHEEFVRGTLGELARTEREWMGEITVVLGPYSSALKTATLSDEAIEARIEQEIATGAASKAIAVRVSAWSGRARNEIYSKVVDRKTRSATSPSQETATNPSQEAATSLSQEAATSHSQDRD